MFQASEYFYVVVLNGLSTLLIFGKLSAMFRKCFLVSVLVICGMQTVRADTVQLKDKASITGKILSEKRDQIAVDVGYTVLVIPRNQIAKVLKTDETELPTKVAVKAGIPADTQDLVENKPGFYS